MSRLMSYHLITFFHQFLETVVIISIDITIGTMDSQYINIENAQRWVLGTVRAQIDLRSSLLRFQVVLDP